MVIKVAVSLTEKAKTEFLITSLALSLEIRFFLSLEYPNPIVPSAALAFLLVKPVPNNNSTYLAINYLFTLTSSFPLNPVLIFKGPYLLNLLNSMF